MNPKEKKVQKIDIKKIPLILIFGQKRPWIRIHIQNTDPHSVKPWIRISIRLIRIRNTLLFIKHLIKRFLKINMPTLMISH